MPAIAHNLQNFGSSPIHTYSEMCHKLASQGIPVINNTIGNPGHPMEQTARDTAQAMLSYPIARKAFLELNKTPNAGIDEAQYIALLTFLREPTLLDYYLAPRPLSKEAQKKALETFNLELKADGKYYLPAGKTIDADTSKALSGYFDQVVAENISYTPIRGYPRALEALARYYNDIYGFKGKDDPRRFRSEDMAFTSSATFAFYAAAKATIAPGDVLILVAPYYPTYHNMANIIQANLVVIPTTAENGFVPTNEAIDKAFAEAEQKYGKDKIRNWFINYPNNPTGSTLSDAHATRLAAKVDELVKRYPSLTVTLDDVYVDVRMTENVSIRNKVKPETLNSIVMILTGAKAQALAGERIGMWETRNPDLARVMTALSSSQTMNPPALAQAMYARVCDDWVKNPARRTASAEFYARNTELFSTEFNKRLEKYKDFLPTYKTPFHRISKATLYTFPSIDAFIGLPVLDGFQNDNLKTDVIRDATDFVHSLLQMHKKGMFAVAGIPGVHYGADKDHIRFSLPHPEPKPLYNTLDTIEKLMELSIDKVKAQLKAQGVEPSAANVRAAIAVSKDRALGKTPAMTPSSVVAEANKVAQTARAA